MAGHMHISLLQDRQTGETTNIVLRFGYLLTYFWGLGFICDKKRSWINNVVMFRVKLRLWKYSLQRERLADMAFLLSKLAFSSSYGYFNRANIPAGSSDTPSLLCTNV